MGLRERKKADTRTALVDAALALFAERGYAHTTVDDIAERAGVSRRTFFRYFATKSEVAFPQRERRLARFALALEDDTGGSPRDRVRAALLTLARDYEENAEAFRQAQSALHAAPELLLAELLVERGWEERIADVLLGSRRVSPQERRQAQVFAAALVGVARSALRDWFEAGAPPDLVRRGERALDAFFEMAPAFAD